MLTAIVSVASALVGGGAVAAFFKWLTDRKTHQIDGWTKLYASYNERLERMDRSLADMQDEIDQLKNTLAAEERRSSSAIGYIRTLRRWIGDRWPDEDVPPIPDLLRSEVCDR